MHELLEQLQPITLEQMSEIRLMNRTDTKFVTCKEKLVELLRLAQGKYYAQVIDGSKVANYMTTYWDTDDHHFYLEHHNGRAPRQKVRVRTYLDSNVSYLEVKTKNNHGRTKKKRVEVPTQDITGENGNEEFLQGLVHRGMNDIHPTVRNRFHRITLVNYGKTERLTIDFDVQFHNMETARDATTGQLVIIELKRDGNVFSPVLEILRQLRIQPSGFSKYCIGSVMTNHQLKHNMFKQKLVKLSKLSKTNINLK
ncbi:MAG: polyphosphate polymerase domain-containing protein [Bacteroidaceae bacterium]|nr:polyphosphate polymerase domain-containing protein [Bacteroidaceae bacterium]MBQ2460405.1 polyphosphate polymerase domain-containing protein [Bacteroidaceae bacterium]MBQ2519280.1 polyphosphate polymerase domain-containing protein [Bacteroidaceae bacterium]MBQ2595948.1 polyphosphate polymerase domain-containing protein [Bacteroidaceae bacterium]MBQ3957914.1 polyphosphate polymerase domain-containing protein [Bacteroidaceae bacterium]